MRAAAAHRRVAHLADVTGAPGSVLRRVRRGISRPGRPGRRGGGRRHGARRAGEPRTRPSLLRGTTTPGTVRQIPGGVGRNIAEGIFRASPPGAPPPFLLSVVGDDLAGGALLEAWRNLGHTLSAAGVRVCSGAATPAVAAVLDAGGEVAPASRTATPSRSPLDPPWIQAHAARIAAARVSSCWTGTARPPAPPPSPPRARRARLRLRVSARVLNKKARHSSGSSRYPWRRPRACSRRASRARWTSCPPTSRSCGPWRAPRGARGRRRADDGPKTNTMGKRKRVAVERRDARDDVDALLDAGIGSVVLGLGALGVVLCRREGNESRRRRTPAAKAPKTPRAKNARALRAHARSRASAEAPACAASWARGCAGGGERVALAAGHDLASAVSFALAAARRATPETDAPPCPFPACPSPRSPPTRGTPRPAATTTDRRRPQPPTGPSFRRRRFARRARRLPA